MSIHMPSRTFSSLVPSHEAFLHIIAKTVEVVLLAAVATSTFCAMSDFDYFLRSMEMLAISASLIN